jgi:hypothetical protein
MRMWSCEDRRAPFVEVFKRSATTHGYDLRMIAPGAVAPTGFAQLKARYRHLSPNPERFELASFRRWFEIAAQVAPNDRFVLADSDLFIGQPFATLPAEVRDFDGLTGSIGATGDVLEDGINRGLSVWTWRLVRQFCDYMVAVYETKTDKLASLHAAKLAMGNARASISDMTLLYGWVQEVGIPFLNTNRLLRDSARRAFYIDHNFFMPEGLGLRFAMTLGRKSVHWRDGQMHLRTRDGEPVIAGSIHLGGRYKIVAEDLERHDQLGLALRSAYILGGRTGRSLLSRAGLYW